MIESQFETEIIAESGKDGERGAQGRKCLFCNRIKCHVVLLALDKRTTSDKQYIWGKIFFIFFIPIRISKTASRDSIEQPYLC